MRATTCRSQQAKLTASASGRTGTGHARQKKIGMKTMQMHSVETKRRHGDLLRSVEMAWTVSLPIARFDDVFDFYRRVIDQDPDRKAQSRPSHNIDGLANALKGKDAHQNGQRYGDGND